MNVYNIICQLLVGGGNRIISKTVRSGLIIYKSGDLFGQGRCWSSSWCSSCPGFMIVTPYLFFCNLQLVSVIKVFAIVAISCVFSVVGFWGNRVFKVNFEVCCHFCCSSTVFCRFWKSDKLPIALTDGTSTTLCWTTYTTLKSLKYSISVVCVYMCVADYASSTQSGSSYSEWLFIIQVWINLTFLR